MNYHGYLIIKGGERSANFWGRFFDPWAGPAVDPLRRHVRAHRRRRRHAAHPRATDRQTPGGRRRQAVDAGSPRAAALRVRADLLRDLGGFDPAVLRGDVLRRRVPVHAGDAVARRHRRGVRVAGVGIHWWVTERTSTVTRPWLTNPPTSSPRGQLFNIFVNGTHPLLPWLAFFCAGMILGRLLRGDSSTADPPSRTGGRLRCSASGSRCSAWRRCSRTPSAAPDAGRLTTRAGQPASVRPGAALHRQRPRYGAHRVHGDLHGRQAVHRSPIVQRSPTPGR